MTEEDVDHSWSEVAQHFDALGDWLRKGGFPPVATGPIFGTHTINVGYPGMVRCGPTRTKVVPIKYVRNSRFSSQCRYAIMTADTQGEDLTRWVMVEYAGDNEVNRWEFPTTKETP